MVSFQYNRGSNKNFVFSIFDSLLQDHFRYFFHRNFLTVQLNSKNFKIFDYKWSILSHFWKKKITDFELECSLNGWVWINFLWFWNLFRITFVKLSLCHEDASGIRLLESSSGTELNAEEIKITENHSISSQNSNFVKIFRG